MSFFQLHIAVIEMKNIFYQETVFIFSVVHLNDILTKPASVRSGESRLPVYGTVMNYVGFYVHF
jgi:hypothetical protein